MIYLRLFCEFFKIGLFSFGGGLATLPFLYDLAGRSGWFTVDEISNWVAISEATPGPLAINIATYAGFRAAGIPGGLLASFALILPTVLIAVLAATVLAKISDSRRFQNALQGLRPAVAGLLLAVSISLLSLAVTGQSSVVLPLTIDPKAVILFVIMVISVFIWKKHPIYYIIAGALCGILFKL